MRVWPYPITSYTAHEVRMFAVENEEWQAFRLTLKGLSTEEKLDKLHELWDNKLRPGVLNNDHKYLPRRWQVAIDNYLQALHRGGLIKPDAEGTFEVAR
jgi:hypothetical protein